MVPIPTTLLEQLQRDEGFRPTPYRDSQGYWTIGYGWCLERRPMSLRIATLILEEQMQENAVEVINHLPWSKGLDEVRRAVLTNVTFNVGLGGLLKFEKMLAAMEANDWATAAKELLDSKYAGQVGLRAERLAEQIRSGVFQ